MRWLLLLAALAGCAHVPTYQRGVLASALMRDDDGLQDASDGHVLAARESMAGADGAGGASCGCR